MRRVFTLGESPEGFQAEKGEIGGFEDSCVGGWFPRAGSEPPLYGRAGSASEVRRYSRIARCLLGKREWWVGKRKKDEAEGRSEREEVEVCSQVGHVPDYLSRRKVITLFASIVPPCAETTNRWRRIP